MLIVERAFSVLPSDYVRWLWPLGPLSLQHLLLSSKLQRALQLSFQPRDWIWSSLLLSPLTLYFFVLSSLCSFFLFYYSWEEEILVLLSWKKVLWSSWSGTRTLVLPRSIVAPAENTTSDWLVSIVDKTGWRTGHFLLEEKILSTALFNG